MINQLKGVVDDLQAGRPISPVTVRTFLKWFGAKRRGRIVVESIREQLAEAQLVTEPDFEGLWADAEITFKNAIDSSSTDNPASTMAPSQEEEASASEKWLSRDATYQISKLPSANKGVIAVKPDENLSAAVTLMLARHISQIAVMTTERDVKGMISWRSIGSRLALGQKSEYVRDFMDLHHEVRFDSSLFEAVPIIVRNDYVLVRGTDSKIAGIVTGSDLSAQFQHLSEPFLLLSEIENLIRIMIGSKFPINELRPVADPGSTREIKSVDDLNFGEYVHILQEDNRWLKLKLLVDRVIFCKDLNEVREIRNDVMHFDPDGPTPEDLDKLRDFKFLLTQLERIAP